MRATGLRQHHALVGRIRFTRGPRCRNLHQRRIAQTRFTARHRIGIARRHLNQRFRRRHAVGASGRYGYSATVFLTNLFLLPHTEAEFFVLPKIVYDTLDELVDDGWVVD